MNFIHSMQTKLFFDLDETLVHSFKATNQDHADQLLNLYDGYWKSAKYCIRGTGWDEPPVWYVSFLRKGTLDLLKFTRDLLGEEHVNMLTLGGSSYAEYTNANMGLGFNPNSQIFPHEVIASYKIHPKFRRTFNILIDNENHDHHRVDRRGFELTHGKVKWLNNLPSENFIQIPEFTVWSESLDPKWTEQYVEDTKAKILELIKTKI